MLHIGMVGADIVHALEYASIINSPPGPMPPKIRVTHELEQAGGGEPLWRCPAAADPKPTSATGLRSRPGLESTRVDAWWAPDRASAESMADQVGVSRVPNTLEELVKTVDAGMVCSWHGSDHFWQTRPFLAAGLPVFVDKPFCENVDEARTMVSLARERDVVLFSSSPWKWSPAIASLRSELDVVAPLRTVTCTGPAVEGPFFYLTHSVETIQFLLGLGARSVRSVEDNVRTTIEIRYDDDRLGVVNGLKKARWIRHVVAYGDNGYAEADISNAHRDEGMINMVASFVESLQTKVAPLPPEYPLEATAILVAANESARNGGREKKLEDLPDLIG